MKFKSGECVIHKLTGEHLLILEKLDYSDTAHYGFFMNGYYVRNNNYEVIKVAEFELMKRVELDNEKE